MRYFKNTSKNLTIFAVSTLFSTAALSGSSSLSGSIPQSSTINSVTNGEMIIEPSADGKGSKSSFTFTASSNVPWTISLTSADAPAGLADSNARYLRSNTDYIQYRIELDREGYDNTDNEEAAIPAATNITASTGTLISKLATFDSLETSLEVFTVHLQSQDKIDYATDAGNYSDTLTITATAQ